VCECESGGSTGSLVGHNYVTICQDAALCFGTGVGREECGRLELDQDQDQDQWRLEECLRRPPGGVPRPPAVLVTTHSLTHSLT
jgi:hypothetical protein